MKIGEIPIGDGNPTLIIAEIGQAHDGSLGMAHAYIDAVADTGAEAIKFQTHIASEESTFDDEFRTKFSLQDKTRFDYWRRMEFSETEWQGIASHAVDKNLLFLSSAFSKAALEMLLRLGIPAVKIASGELMNDEIMESIIHTKLPVILSTGMSNLDEIDQRITWLKNEDLPVIVMQCTSKYPTSLEQVGLNIIDEFRERFNTHVGLSDHSGTIFPGLAAISRGIDIIEVHVTFDKALFGPDNESSITIDELKFLVEFRDALNQMNNNPVNKDKIAGDLSGMRNLFYKSITPSKALKKGTVLKANMLKVKKPGFGINPDNIGKIIGKRLKRDVVPERLLTWEDIDGE